MEVDGKESIKKIMLDASKRMDGRAMYTVCLFFVVVITYSVLADYFKVPMLFLPFWKVVFGAFLMVPITFLTYLSLLYFSTSGKYSEILNALFLISIPYYIAYKLFV